MKKKDLWVFVIISIMIGSVSSCQMGDDELGDDILPPEDNIFLFRDTIFEIDAFPVSGKRLISSETNFDVNRVLLLGNLQDTLVGISEAAFITQFNTNLSFTSGPNMEIDSLMLFLYVQDYVGDMDQEITIRVYELTERIYMDSLYYSDFDPVGKINPVPLVEKSFMPENETMLDFLIEDPDFRDKFLALGQDTSLFRDDSIFKDHLNGLYIEAESTSPDGSMARVHLAHPQSLLSLKYANDSTQVDSIEGVEFKWSQFSIDQKISQKINLFEHDHGGTYLSTIIDNDSVRSPYCYVQGMAGVNTRISFTSMEEWIEKSPISVSSAALVFDVVPEDESGILYDDLPDKLMLKTILDDESFELVYDFYVLWINQQTSLFGGKKKAKSEGLFSDTTYTYRFNIPLHFQYMVDGLKTDTDFILQLNDGKVNPGISKLWSNLPATRQRIRLEIVYLQL